MFEPLTLRMPELAERWKMTPVQALEFADVNGLPIYFNFSGLAFFDSNEWCRTHGDQDIRRELKTLSEGIASGESWLARRSRGETGKYDFLTDQEAQELRQSIEASKRSCKAINGSMPFCVELDNLKDTDAPIHQPAAMLVAAD